MQLSVERQSSEEVAKSSFTLSTSRLYCLELTHDTRATGKRQAAAADLF